LVATLILPECYITLEVVQIVLVHRG